MTVLALHVVNGVGLSAPRLSARLRQVLTRVVAARYAEQRAQLARNGSGGMI